MDKKEAIRPKLRTMEIGDCHIFPVSRVKVIKSTVSRVSNDFGFKFTTHIDGQYFKVIRIR